VLGVILALCSLGLITALLGILLSVISNQTIPRMKLKHSRKFRWFVFNEYNEQSAALVSSIKSEEPDARIIFCDSDAKRKYDKGVIYLDCSPEELIDLKGSSERILYFCIGDDSWDNFGKAKEAAGLGIETYCLSDYGLKEIMGNLHIYSRKVIISRCYWKDYPVARNEKTIVLIGSGDIAAELLGRGLLTNVFEAGRYISYHVFGDSSYFRNAHPEIIKALCGGNPENDSLFLHEECWQHHAGIIRNADRIIICEDDDKSNLRIYKELIRYFPTSADVHLRLDAHAEQIACFGSIGSVFTLASFIRDDINRLAVIHNKIYSEDSETPIEWSELSDHQKGSNITPERMRLDFNFDRKLTPEEKQTIEDQVNAWIKSNYKVIFDEYDKEYARDTLHAEGQFWDKYDQKVKVYTINPDAPVSIEICGGPHVENTGKLGHFKIKKEESSSAGVRRIKAILE
jgi:hypothetical protein